MQDRFVKEESQSLYFQAIAKMKLQDFSQALILLNQALGLEKGNLLVLEAKAKSEKKMGFFSKYYQTLKTASEVAEVGQSWTENLLEAQYYFKDYSNYDSVDNINVDNLYSCKKKCDNDTNCQSFLIHNMASPPDQPDAVYNIFGDSLFRCEFYDSNDSSKLNYGASNAIFLKNPVNPPI